MALIDHIHRCNRWTPKYFHSFWVDAMPDGSGAVTIDGKMQDDAIWKQAKVMVDLARRVAARDPELAASYAL